MMRFVNVVYVNANSFQERERSGTHVQNVHAVFGNGASNGGPKQALRSFTRIAQCSAAAGAVVSTCSIIEPTLSLLNVRI
jgi:hypothetical protein